MESGTEVAGIDCEDVAEFCFYSILTETHELRDSTGNPQFT
jgi:hypothetical protein